MIYNDCGVSPIKTPPDMAQQDAFQRFLSLLERSNVAGKLGTLRDVIEEDCVSENQSERSGRVLNIVGEILNELLASYDKIFSSALRILADLARSGLGVLFSSVGRS